MRKTRVLLVQEAMGGCGRHVADLVLGLDPERYDITLVYGTSRIDDYYRSKLPDMARHARLVPCPDLVRAISPAHELRAYRTVSRLIREIRPDIVHCHSSKAGVIGRLAAKRHGVKHVFYTPHAYSFQAPEFGGRKRVVFVGVERWLSRHCTTMTFNVSRGERDAALAEHLDDASKFEVVHNGVPDVPLPPKAQARKELGVPDDAYVVGATARFVEQKDPMTSVAIAAKVIREEPRTHVVYIGDGPFRERMEAYCAGRGIADHVHFLGYRTDADTIVSAFDVYLLPSLYEGMPYSLVESLRAGVPIAATDVTGNDEVVQPGANGLLFPVGDAQAGADAVLELLRNPLPAEQVRRTYTDRFTVDAMLEHITALYRQGMERG